MNTSERDRGRLGAPPALLAIIQAARLVGDRSLERAARQELMNRHGIEIFFRTCGRRGRWPVRSKVAVRPDTAPTWEVRTDLDARAGDSLGVLANVLLALALADHERLQQAEAGWEGAP